jgi:hypothetical protein
MEWRSQALDQPWESLQLARKQKILAPKPWSSLQGGGNGSCTLLIKQAEVFVDEEVDVVMSRFPQLTLVSRENMYSESRGLVSYVQHIRWYPHVRAWRCYVECVIKNTEYVSENMVALPQSWWNQISVWAAPRGKREREWQQRRRGDNNDGRRWWCGSAGLGFWWRCPSQSPSFIQVSKGHSLAKLRRGWYNGFLPKLFPPQIDLSRESSLRTPRSSLADRWVGLMWL